MVSRATLSEQVSEAIREDILNGVLLPGDRLRAAELSQRYGVSPTPLREAIERLVAERFVDRDPRQGARVAAVSERELDDIYWLRDSLEGIALERSIERSDEKWREGVEKAWKEFREVPAPRDDHEASSVSRWLETHRRFHRALLSACDSPWLLNFVSTLVEHSERYRVLSALTGSRDSASEHRAIVDAALAGKVQSAVTAHRLHIAMTVDTVKKRMAEEAIDGG